MVSGRASTQRTPRYNSPPTEPQPEAEDDGRWLLHGAPEDVNDPPRGSGALVVADETKPVAAAQDGTPGDRAGQQGPGQVDTTTAAAAVMSMDVSSLVQWSDGASSAQREADAQQPTCVVARVMKCGGALLQP